MSGEKDGFQIRLCEWLIAQHTVSVREKLQIIYLAKTQKTCIFREEEDERTSSGNGTTVTTRLVHRNLTGRGIQTKCGMVYKNLRVLKLHQARAKYGSWKK